MGGRFGRGWTHVYVRLRPFTVHLNCHGIVNRLHPKVQLKVQEKLKQFRTPKIKKKKNWRCVAWRRQYREGKEKLQSCGQMFGGCSYWKQKGHVSVHLKLEQKEHWQE